MQRVVYKTKPVNKNLLVSSLLYFIEWGSRNDLHVEVQAVQLYVKNKLASILILQVQSLFYLTNF
jgi:hypothetical protein